MLRGHLVLRVTLSSSWEDPGMRTHRPRWPNTRVSHLRSAPFCDTQLTSPGTPNQSCKAPHWRWSYPASVLGPGLLSFCGFSPRVLCPESWWTQSPWGGEWHVLSLDSASAQFRRQETRGIGAPLKMLPKRRSDSTFALYTAYLCSLNLQPGMFLDRNNP